jgi:hypothetical protein
VCLCKFFANRAGTQEIYVATVEGEMSRELSGARLREAPAERNGRDRRISEAHDGFAELGLQLSGHRYSVGERSSPWEVSILGAEIRWRNWTEKKRMGSIESDPEL